MLINLVPFLIIRYLIRITMHGHGENAGLAFGRDRIVVSTLRCGRNNPGSNPGHGMTVSCYGMRVNILKCFSLH